MSEVRQGLALLTVGATAVLASLGACNFPTGGPHGALVSYPPTAFEAAAAACPSAEPAEPPDLGLPQHGRYNYQRLPKGWAALPDEAAVTRSIAELRDGPGWPCFVKFNTGAATVYEYYVREARP